MAKIIRCPNCGENVEIPPNPTGQIVTCIACGTAMRLKSRKEAGQPKGDASGSSLGGSLSGSMTATRITSEAVQSSPDDPPSLGGECEVCGKPTDPADLIEDRGHLTCRACMKKPTSSRPRKSFGDEELIPFRAPERVARRGDMITLGLPFFVGLAALLLYIACSVYLQFNPRPIGRGVIAKTPDEPPPSKQTSWDEQNLPILVKMMEDANRLKADPNRLAEARQKYQAVVAHAKGNASGSQEVRRLVDLAEQEAEALRLAAVPAPPAPPTAPVAPTPTPVEVPDTLAAAPNSVFDDKEVSINEKLNAGLTDLEAALTAGAEAAEAPAKAALVKFSEARELLIQEKRNIPEDPGWTFANHGTAVGYILAKNYPHALLYLDRLPAPPDRAALLNRIVTHLQMRENYGDALQLLINHLKSDAGADDGYALNLLGTTLARYPEEAFKEDKALVEARETYDEFVKRLGANHPGERRWGARWIPINEWAAKDKERRVQLNKIEDLERSLLKVRSRLNRVQKIVETGNASPAHRATLMAEQAEEQQLLTRIQTERAKIPPEEWLTPEQIVPVLPDVTAVNARTRGGDKSRGGRGGATTQPAPAAG